MLIDWFTVSAQVLNFLILVWLLKRFLYKPILKAIDDRENGIAEELKMADTKRAEAQKERTEFEHKNEDFDQQRAGLLKQARDEAKTERERLLNEARKAVVDLNVKHQETLKKEEQDLHQSIVRRTQQEVFSIARKALVDLAGTSLEERMVDIFVRRLKKLTPENRLLLSTKQNEAGDPIMVSTSSDLSEPQRSELESAIKESLGKEVRVQFKTTPDLLAGIELKTNGQKIGWNVADYLGALENSVSAHEG
jgi:F-type H+-transporting ATPase subunit b